MDELKEIKKTVQTLVTEVEVQKVYNIQKTTEIESLKLLVESTKKETDAAIELNTKKTDKLISRFSIIGSFFAGVLFISSETGGEILRKMLGVLL